MIRKILCLLGADHQNEQGGESLSVQHELVLREQQLSLSMIDRANESLDEKAARLLQASAVIVALISALGFLTVFQSGSGHLSKPVLAAALLPFLLMIWFSVRAWSPDQYKIPGSLDWDHLYTEYIHADADECYARILSNYIQGVDFLRDKNVRKAKWVKGSAWAFGTQVFLLFLVAVLA